MRKKIEKLGSAENSTDVSDLSKRLVAAAVRGVGNAHVRLEMDIPAELSFPRDSEKLAQLVQSLVGSAVASLECDGEIAVTAWQAGETLEIEVADSGPAVQDRPRFLPLAVGALGAELVWQNCPQGGAAVTVVVPRVAPKRSAA